MYASTATPAVGSIVQFVPLRASMIWSPVPLVRVIVPVLVVQPGAGTLAGSTVNVADSLIFPSRLADPVPVTETQTKLGLHGTTVPTSEVLAENGSRLVAPANCGI